MAGSQPQRRNSPTQGAAMLALSALFFALMGGLIREASSTVNNETVVFFRNLVGVLFFLPLALTRGIGPLRTRRPLSHLLRTTYGLGGMYCYFYALAHLPLTDAMLFSYAAPVFTPLIAHLWIKEPLTRRMMVATLVGFLGVLLVARPSGAVVAPIALVGIASSLMAACAFVSIREMSDSEPAYRIVFYFALFGTLFSRRAAGLGLAAAERPGTAPAARRRTVRQPRPTDHVAGLCPGLPGSDRTDRLHGHRFRRGDRLAALGRTAQPHVAARRRPDLRRQPDPPAGQPPRRKAPLNAPPGRTFHV